MRYFAARVHLLVKLTTELEVSGECVAEAKTVLNKIHFLLICLTEKYTFSVRVFRRYVKNVFNYYFGDYVSHKLCCHKSPKGVGQ